MWHKNRSEQSEPITEFEKLFGHTTFTKDGCETLHRYAGHDVDSYRTEVLGVLASFGRPGPLHFGLDNHAAFDDVMAIISKQFAESKPKKPWTLVKNGDLLERVHVQSESKKCLSINGSWGRGHCKDDDVVAGGVSED